MPKVQPSPGSDIDILVEMPPNSTKLCTVGDILEPQLKTKVDLLRRGSHVEKPFLKKFQKLFLSSNIILERLENLAEHIELR